MSSRGALRILLISPLDYEHFTNNLECHHVLYYARIGCRPTLMYKTINWSARLGDMVRDAGTFRIRCREDGTSCFVAVDPFLNYCGGVRTRADAWAATSVRTGSLKYTFIRLFYPLRVLRDLFVVPCFVLAAVWKLKGTFHVCIGFGPWGGLAGWLLRKVGKVELLVYQDRDYEPGLLPDRLRQAYTAAVERFTIKRADLTISIGQLLADLRRRQTGRPIEVIPSGVEWDKFAGARSNPKTGQTLIYVGNVISWSGLDHAIRALPEILRACPTAKLLIVGDGLPGYLAYLRQLVEQLHIRERVHFLGQRPSEELPDLLAGAEIGLANSEPVAFRKYACPLKVIEYMAAGLPVIATEGTEAAQLLTREQSGIAIPYEVENLAQTAIALFNDSQLYQRLRANGMRASAGMNWEILLAKELDLISKRYAEVAGLRSSKSVFKKPLSEPRP